MLPITHRLLNTFPALHSTQPLPPALPNLFKFAALTLFWNTRPALEVVKHPKPVGPRRNRNVNQTEHFTKEERTFCVHFADELFEVVEKLGLFLFQAVFALVLQEAVIRWDNARPNIWLR